MFGRGLKIILIFTTQIDYINRSVIKHRGKFIQAFHFRLKKFPPLKNLNIGLDKGSIVL